MSVSDDWSEDVLFGPDQPRSDDVRQAVLFDPDQPKRFLTAWLGPPSRNVAEPAARYLPAALAEWHRQVARWDAPVVRQNRVPAGREMRGDMLLVGVECQEVWLWGIRDDDDDRNPLVWERYNRPGWDWTPTGERLDEFLWHFTLAEVAFFSGHNGMGVFDVTAAEVARFTNTWTALRVKPWGYPGPNQIMWTRDGLLAWTFVNQMPDSPVKNPNLYGIAVSARSRQDLLRVDDSGIEWAWDSR